MDRRDINCLKNAKKRQQTYRMAGKITLIFAGCFLLLYLLGKTVTKIAEPKLEADHVYMSLQEAGNLVWLLADTAKQAGSGPGGDSVLEVLREMSPGADGALTCEQARQMLACLPEENIDVFRGYAKKEKIEAKDWYQWFDQAKQRYDPTGEIQDLELIILGTGAQIRNSAGEEISGQRLVALDGIYRFHAPVFAQKQAQRRPVLAVARRGELYGLRGYLEEEPFTLDNVWVSSVTVEEMVFFWEDYEILLQEEGVDRELLSDYAGYAEMIADLTFADGYLVSLHPKGDKISGRLLRVADGGIEVEGHGFYPFSDTCKIYRLYGRMQRLRPEDLCIGYAFTDFILEDGKIVAALVPKEEKMEYIRVLIKTSGYGSAYHDTLEVRADCDCQVIYGGYQEQQMYPLKAGETLTLSGASEWFAKGDRVQVRPEILTGSISLCNVERARQSHDYRGSFEFVRYPEGIVAVNEVLLEEYLYAVVPSEMPASWPLEALKSQAVCARTYAYQKMKHAGLPTYGAHVDDSAGFQVYHNIDENPETTRAVKETKGEVLFYGEAMAETYYYSTSCGFGADASVWQGGGAAQYPYLMAQAIDRNSMQATLNVGESLALNQEDAEVNEFSIEVIAAMAPVAQQALLLQEETVFDTFLDSTMESFYEKQEPWYRWQYRVETLDLNQLAYILQQRYEASPTHVLTRQPDGSFLSGASTLGRLADIKVVKRGAGGVIEELLLEGEKNAVLVKTEHTVRYVLCDAKSRIRRQDGSEVDAATMLPSAFFTITPFKEDGFVVGYSLSGGGFGHGVGLSQSGAKNMAADDKKYDEILPFFYKGCRIEDIYHTADGS